MNSTVALSVPAAIAARHSVRAYSDAPVPAEDLNQILELTGLAPSAFNAQPWRFVVVRDPTVKAQLRAAAYGQGQVEAAPVLIVMYSDMADVLANVDEILHPGMPADRRAAAAQGFVNGFANKSEAEREAWGAEQSNIALGFLLLAAQSYGYATSPMLGFEPDKVKALLGLPAHVRVPALVALGRPAEDGFPSHRHPLERIARSVE